MVQSSKQRLAASDETESSILSLDSANLALDPSSSSLRPPVRNSLEHNGVIPSVKRSTTPGASTLSAAASPGHFLSPVFPSLPALSRFQGTSDTQSLSPDNRRTDASTYYTTAWGSPYATPSSRRLSGTLRNRQVNFDADLLDTSPFSIHSHHQPLDSIDDNTERLTAARLSEPSFAEQLEPDNPGRSRARSIQDFTQDWINQYLTGHPRSERTNWLSDDSDSEAGSFLTAHNFAEEESGWLGLDDPVEDDILKTPTSSSFPKRGKKGDRSGKFGSIRSRARHIPKKSTDTLKQSDFWDLGHDQDTAPTMSNPDPFAGAVEQDTVARSLNVTPTEKPLPPPPQNEEASIPPAVPQKSIPTAPSFQRPKKRVPWRGRQCIIALPLEDARGSAESGFRLLSFADNEQKLKKWEDEGYDVRGYTGAQTQSQSCPAFPDPTDSQKIWEDKSFTVSFPNQGEWEDYVNFLQEEKLRALGVFLGEPEPVSTNSPLSAPMSQNSSQFPGNTISPPIPASSTASNQLNMPVNPFAAAFNPSVKAAASLGSFTSPSTPFGLQTSSPYQTQQAPMGNESMYPFLPYQHTPPVHNAQSPQNIYGFQQGLVSPMGTGSMANLGSLLQPVSPMAPDDMNHFSRPDLYQLNHSMHEQSQQAYEKNGGGDMTLPSAHQQVEEADSDTIETPSGPEIVHPTPRSHRHNLSETLQKGIGKAEHELEEEQINKRRGDSVNAQWPEPNDAGLGQQSYFPAQPHTQSGRLQQQLFGERGYDHGGIEDGSDIDTNPSLTASRSPIEFQGNNMEANNFHQNNTGPASLFSGHKSKNSLTNFNVSAESFDPTSSFSPSNFSFVPNSFHMNSTDYNSQPASNRGPPEQISHSARSSGFNISAPAFTPGQNHGSVSSGAGFKFSAASFNVEAPVFNPGPSINLTSPQDNASGPRANIFGDFEESHARPAKQSKAIPIVRPDESGKTDDKADNGEGEGGRFGAQGREKRARRVGGDGEEEPVFASHAPTDADSKSTPDEPKENVSNELSETNEEHKGPMDRAASQSREQSPEPAVQQQESTTWKPFEFKNEQDAVAFNAAVPSGATADQSDNAPTQTAESQSPDGAVAGPSGMSGATTQEPNLKPTAQPFEFKASTPPAPSPKPAQSPSQPPPKKPAGIQASRYAKSESPEPIAPSLSTHIQEPPVHHNMVVHGDSEEDTLDEKELDAVMQQLNDDSSAGVERTFTPIKTQDKIYDHSNMPGNSTAPRLIPNEDRSNAPSPSARGEGLPKYNPNVRIPPQSGLTSHQSLQASPQSPVRQLNSHVQEHISDWDDAVSSGEDEEFRQRTRFFDTHVDEIIGASLDDRMAPLENSLGDIQHTLSVLLSQREYRQRKSGFDETEHSDADDEDEEEEESGPGSRSPWSRGDRRIAKIKQAVLEALSANQSPPKDMTPKTDLSEINSSLAELRTAIATIPVPDESAKLKEIITGAITNHPKFNEPEPSRDPEESPEKLRLQIEGLQNMLRVADERAEQEYNARRSVQDILAETQRQLTATEQDAARHRESAQSAEKAFQEFKDAKLPEIERIELESSELKEQRDSWGLTLSQLTEKNIGLEGTLDEYRVTADQMRNEAEQAKAENKDLRGTISILKNQMGDNMKSRHNLRERFDRLQEDMINATNEVAQDRSNWKKKEEEQIIKYNVLQSQHEQEVTRRQKLELHLGDLEQKEMEATKLKFILGQSQEENAKLEEVLMNVRQESHDYQSKAARFEREFSEARESSRAEIQRVRTSMESDIEAANHQVNYVRAELEIQLTNLQNQLDSTKMDSDTEKAKYELLLEEARDSRVAALQDAAESKQLALQDQRLAHERTLNDLRERHARALHNSSEDRRRDETHYMELLALRDEKIDHLQDKIVHMEEKLQIAKDAARAAAEAAQSAKSTPAAPSPANPTSPSLSFAQGSAIPDKISPQALRESIMVLQDQLQQREGRIEELEHELSTMDKDAPLKIKEKETEINWLRELLNVRIDDLQDLVKIVSRPSFDQRAVRDAAIRLKANLQMQQQEKDRAMSGSGDQPFPSLASISSLAASPRALPLAAAAAWGNWRKGRENSVASTASSGPSHNGRNEQETPSKTQQQQSNSQSFLSGLMTPPGSNARGTVNHRHRHGGHSATMAPRQPNSESRPLRSHISNHSHSHSSSRRRQMDNMVSPTTPPLLRTSSYDHDAEATQYGDDDAYINDNDTDSIGSIILPQESNFARSDDSPFGPAI